MSSQVDQDRSGASGSGLPDGLRNCGCGMPFQHLRLSLPPGFESVPVFSVDGMKFWLGDEDVDAERNATLVAALRQLGFQEEEHMMDRAAQIQFLHQTQPGGDLDRLGRFGGLDDLDVISLVQSLLGSGLLGRPRRGGMMVIEVIRKRSKA